MREARLGKNEIKVEKKGIQIEIPVGSDPMVGKDRGRKSPILETPSRHNATRDARTRCKLPGERQRLGFS